MGFMGGKKVIYKKELQHIAMLLTLTHGKKE